MAKSDDIPLLTLAQHEQAKANVADLKKKMSELAARLAEEEDFVAIGDKLLKRRSTAISCNLPENNGKVERNAGQSSLVARRVRPTWTSEITKIVNEVGIISYPSLKSKLSEGPLGDRLKRSDKGFYGGLGKLEARGVIVRHNDHAFTAEAFEKYEADVEAGLRDEIVSETSTKSSPMADAICDFLRYKPHGASSADILAHVRNIPQFNRTLNKTPTTLYNNLSRLVARDVLSKNEHTKVYRLNDDADEYKEGPAEAEPSENVGAGDGSRGMDSYPQPDGSIPSASTQISRGDSERQLSFSPDTNPEPARQRERKLA